MPSVTPSRLIDGGGTAPAPPARMGRANRPWRIVTLWTLLGLFGWLVLTVGVVWFARDLDQWTIARVPAGYWWAAQGAIGGYILIIVIYCALMEWLEVRHSLPVSQARPAAESPAYPRDGETRRHD